MGASGGGGAVAETFTAQATSDQVMVIGPVQVSKVTNSGGGAATVALYDSAFSAAAPALFSQSISAGSFVAISPAQNFVNGVYVDITTAERVTNGTFASDVSGWTAPLPGGTISWDAGTLKLTVGAGLGGRAVQTITGLTIGVTYTVLASITAVSGAGTALFRITTDTAGSSTGQVFASSTVSAGNTLNVNTTFVAAATSITLAVAGGAFTNVNADNISLTGADGVIDLELAA